MVDLGIIFACIVLIVAFTISYGNVVVGWIRETV